MTSGYDHAWHSSATNEMDCPRRPKAAWLAVRLLGAVDHRVTPPTKGVRLIRHMTPASRAFMLVRGFDGEGQLCSLVLGRTDCTTGNDVSGAIPLIMRKHHGCTHRYRVARSSTTRSRPACQGWSRHEPSRRPRWKPRITLVGAPPLAQRALTIRTRLQALQERDKPRWDCRCACKQGHQLTRSD
jgi:hypothetical protein